MFTVKHAIMEILNKSKTLDEVLSVLDKSDQEVVIAAFDLMKAKLGGSIDTMDTLANGQWSLEKNTLDYSEINALKPSTSETPVLDYAKMNTPEAKKPWAGTIKRKKERDAKLEAKLKADYQSANKSEDDVKSMKDKYSEKKPKPMSDMVADVKEKYTPKVPKSDDQKVIDIKDKYNKDTKLKDEQPFKTNVKLAKP